MTPTEYNAIAEQIFTDPKFRAALVKRVGSNQELQPKDLFAYVREAVALWVDAIETSAAGRVIGSCADKNGVNFKPNIHHALVATRQNAGFKL